MVIPGQAAQEGTAMTSQTPSMTYDEAMTEMLELQRKEDALHDSSFQVLFSAQAGKLQRMDELLEQLREVWSAMDRLSIFLPMASPAY